MRSIILKDKLRDDIEQAINKHSAENRSDTPDFILAQYLSDCLTAFDNATIRRTEWYTGDNKQNPDV